jgi:peptidoglycan hydrolase CwlO-like protein
MSVGDMFPLQPLNFVSKQDLDTDLSNITSRLTTLDGNVTFLLDTVRKIEQNLTYINNQLQKQQTTINQLNSTINTMNTNNIPNNGNYFYSDPIPLSIPFVKHNNYRVF